MPILRQDFAVSNSFLLLHCLLLFRIYVEFSSVDPEGKHGVRTPLPLKNKNRVFSNSGPDPLKNQAAFNDWPSSARFQPSTEKKTSKKKLVKVVPPISKFSGPAHGFCNIVICVLSSVVHVNISLWQRADYFTVILFLHSCA